MIVDVPPADEVRNSVALGHDGGDLQSSAQVIMMTRSCLEVQVAVLDSLSLKSLWSLWT